MEEFVHWGSVSWSNRVHVIVTLISVNLMCPAISGAICTFPFKAGCWNGASFLAEVVSCIPEMTIIQWVLAITSKIWFFAFSSTGISSVNATYIWLCGCNGVGAGCYIMNIFVSTFHCQGYLSSLVEIQLFFLPMNICRYGHPWHLQPASPLTYPG